MILGTYPMIVEMKTIHLRKMESKNEMLIDEEINEELNAEKVVVKLPIIIITITLIVIIMIT